MKRDKQESQAQFTRRALFLGAGGAAVFAGLAARLYSLQIVDHDDYRLMSEDNQFNFRLQPPSRGRILDRFGVPVADNRDSYRILLVPEQVDDARQALARIAEHVPLSEARIERLLREIARTPDFRPVTVAEDLDWQTFARINLNLPQLSGVTPEVGEVRHYPLPQSFAHVVGYVQAAPEEVAGEDPLLRHPGFRIGRGGVESSQEETLRGSAGSLKVEVNAYGRVIRELPDQSLPSVQGRDVQLSIDAQAQRFASERLEGQSGAALSMDLATGELLSLVSAPGFDPNLFVQGISQDDFSALNNNPYQPLYNKALLGRYAPASTVKGMFALAALEAGVIDPRERITCRGSTPLGDRVFHCWRREGHGPVNLHEALKTSCDVYFYEVAQRLGIERMASMLRRMGVGDDYEIGMNMPGFARGNVPTPQWKRARRGEGWSLGDTYNAGIGQGFMLMTPLELLVMTARLATGRAVRPTLLRQGDAEPPVDLGFNADQLRAIHEAHVGVVHEGNGTAYWPLGGSAVREFMMAGKTGTAQVYSISAEERARGVRDQEDLPWRLRNHGLFIAYGPAETPSYAVAVVIAHGGGGTRAAGPAHDILGDLIRRDPAGRLTPPPGGLALQSAAGGG
ncbi:MAG: penicillin-binding protein 2 [Pseudomonadota bacterium]